MLNRCKETVLRSDVRNEGKIFLSQLSPFNWNFVDPLSAHIFLTACISESNLFWLLANLLWIVWGWTQIPSCESLSISYEKNPKKIQYMYMCVQLNLFKRQLKGNQKKRSPTTGGLLIQIHFIWKALLRDLKIMF